MVLYAGSQNVPSLKEYQQKRRFDQSPEPKGKVRSREGNHFVVQEHHARRLHYDFRLEVDGVLKSWAVPKGPSMDPADKRLAVQTEDHPIEYRTFQGQIPKGHYGAGQVKVWDEGTYEVEGGRSASEQIAAGEIKFILHGRKLEGSFVLVKLRGSYQHGSSGKNEWLMIKHREPGRKADQRYGSIATAPTAEVQKMSRPRGGRQGASAGSKATPTRKMPSGAIRRPMLDTFTPALATISDHPFSDPAWIFEIKWDGARALARIAEDEVRLIARSNRDVTREYPELLEMPASIDAREACLDGEIVVLDSSGRSDFERLQKRFGVKNPSVELQQDFPVSYYAFDLLYCDGYDLRGSPLVERKELLRTIMRPGSRILYSDHQAEKGKELYQVAAQKGLEGIVAKRAASKYPSGRTGEWLKFKVSMDLDAVVGGWTDPRGAREYFGALLLGLYEGEKLLYIGSAGSGFTSETQKRLWSQLQTLRVSQCPFAERPETRERAYWTNPALVARIKYSTLTKARQLRAPRFVGMVEDREPANCTFESEFGPASRNRDEEPEENQREPKTAPNEQSETVRQHARTRKAPAPRSETDLSSERGIEQELNHGTQNDIFIELDGVRLHLTNLNKVYFPEDGYTKRALLAHYYRVAPFLLPFLRDRPLVLRRYPDGIAGEAFFQKDARNDTPAWMKTATIFSEDKKKPIRYLLANDRPALLYLTNLGCIDHNPWSSRYNDTGHPDYIFFDLDPTPETPFSTVLAAARAFNETLQKLGISVFSKTSGATGFHIFIPVEPVYTYAQARAFVQTIASFIAKQYPDMMTFERTVRKRPNGRIYIDAHQNSEGQSLASVYSVRAFPHAPVSTPVTQKEIGSLATPDKWNIASFAKRIADVGDLWGDFWKRRQRLEAVLQDGSDR